MINPTEPSVQVEFTLDIGGGRLEASAVVPAGNVNLTELLPVLQNLSSNVIGGTVQIVEREGYKISCCEGCGACCRQLVPLSIFEAEFLAEWIRSLPEERQAELAHRFDAALIALRDAGILARMDLDFGAPGGPAEEAFALDYLRQRVPCPFLENESCSIHPIRPLICREYLVTSPAEHCYEPSRDKVQGVPIPIKLSQVIFDIGSQVAEGTRGWFPLVYLFAWMRAGGGHPGQAVSGPGPQLLHEIVKRLVTTPKAEPAATAD